MRKPSSHVIYGQSAMMNNDRNSQNAVQNALHNANFELSLTAYATEAIIFSGL